MKEPDHLPLFSREHPRSSQVMTLPPVVAVQECDLGFRAPLCGIYREWGWWGLHRDAVDAGLSLSLALSFPLSLSLCPSVRPPLFPQPLYLSLSLSFSLSLSGTCQSGEGERRQKDNRLRVLWPTVGRGGLYDDVDKGVGSLLFPSLSLSLLPLSLFISLLIVLA